ncbi:MAG: hypothetical protein M3003_08210 [Candidatus Dormibacteraeota bacterium]|nr:hypothetical protein [Candidatus Dormibacteraeota bacterium]
MSRPNSILAGAGAIGFAVLTFAAIFFVNWPGGGYSESFAKSYVASANLPIALTGTLIGLIGVVGLICLLAYLTRAAEESSPAITLVPQIVWAVGLVGAAAFGVGWGLVSAQPLAHVEAGVDLSVAPTLTYMISEATSAIIFGAAPMLVGFALLVLTLGSGRALPPWLRWLTLVAGVVALTSLAFFTFFLFLIWNIVIGIWLLIGGRARGSATGRAQ